MSGFLHTLRVIPTLVRLFVRSEMEYRGAWLLDRLAQIVNYGASFAAIWVLLAKFDTLAGWQWPEIAFLISFQLLAYSIGASFSFVQMMELEETIRRGQFDVLMVKPFSPWAYIVFSRYNVAYAGHVVLAVGLLVWAILHVDVTWTPAMIAYLVAALIGGSALVAAILTMIGAAAFVLVRSRHLYTVFFGFFELLRYPLTIFPASIQWLLVTALPLAFVSYAPVAWLLGKPVAIVGDTGGLLAPLVGPLVALLAALEWRWCVSRYQGAGG